MPFLLRPTGETDLANATLYPEGPLPQIISSLEPGTFDLARLEWSPQTVIVTDDPTLPADPDFAMGATGPYFVDPANVPANTTRIRHEFEIFVPSSVAEYNGGRILVAQESTGFDVDLYAIGGATYLQVERIEDGHRQEPAERETALRRRGGAGHLVPGVGPCRPGDVGTRHPVPGRRAGHDRAGRQFRHVPVQPGDQLFRHDQRQTASYRKGFRFAS